MKPGGKDEVAGKIREVKGAVKEKVGKLTRNPDLEAKGGKWQRPVELNSPTSPSASRPGGGTSSMSSSSSATPCASS